MSNYKQARSKNWKLICYLPFDVALERVCQLVLKNYVRYYAIALHAKDLDDLGNLKESHCHIIINLYNARSQQEICSHFVDVSLNAGNCLGLPVTNKKLDCEYLWHKNDLDKYQYNVDDVVSNNIMFWLGDSIDYDEQCYCILQDMLKGVDLLVMVKRYGRDFLIHYNSYKSLLFDYREQKKYHSVLQRDD